MEENILFEVVSKDLYVYRIEKKKIYNDEILLSEEKEGFAVKKSLQDYIDGTSVHIKKNIFIQNKECIPLFSIDKKVEKEYLEFGVSDKFISFFREEENLKPYTAFKNKICSKEDLIYFYSSDHKLFDYKKEYLPQAIYLDYINNNFHDGAYDLKKVVEILSKRSDIRFNKEKSFSNEIITNITYYNANKYKNQKISVWWSPSREEYITIQKDSKNSSYQGKVIFDLDMLGLRAGEAAYYDDFYMSKKYDGTDPDEEDESEYDYDS